MRLRLYCWTMALRLMAPSAIDSASKNVSSVKLRPQRIGIIGVRYLPFSTRAALFKPVSRLNRLAMIVSTEYCLRGCRSRRSQRAPPGQYVPNYSATMLIKCRSTSHLLTEGLFNPSEAKNERTVLLSLIHICDVHIQNLICLMTVGGAILVCSLHLDQR